MRVMILEASSPSDFFNNKLDGLATQYLLNLLQVDNRLIFVTDKIHFKMAVEKCILDGYDYLHLSCHGDVDERGLVLTDQRLLAWGELAEILTSHNGRIKGLILTTCFGGHLRLAQELENKRRRPKVIFGSTEALAYEDYFVAWSILYRRLKKCESEGHGSDAWLDEVQMALEDISATISPTFLYRRWNHDERKYLRYPGKGKTYYID